MKIQRHASLFTSRTVPIVLIMQVQQLLMLKVSSKQLHTEQAYMVKLHDEPNPLFYSPGPTTFSNSIRVSFSLP